MESIYSSVAQFHEAAPWRVIDNSFPLWISVRTSLSPDDWSPNSSNMFDYEPEIRIIQSAPPKSSPSHLFGPNVPSTDSEITKYCLVAGNTDYGGRYGTLMQEMIEKVKWNLPTTAERGTNIQNILKVSHASFSMGPRYKFTNGNRVGLDLFRKYWSSLPDAKQMRWMDAALRAIIFCASDKKGFVMKSRGLNNKLHLGFPTYEVEMRFPSWNIEGSLDQGKICYAFVRGLVKKSYDPNMNSNGGEGLLESEIGDRSMSYYPGGHVCYFCGSPKFCSVANPNGNLQTCSRCRGVKYCNAECQKKDWKRHKRWCKPIPKR